MSGRETPKTPAESNDGGSRPPLEVLVANHRAFLAFLEKRVESRAAAEDLLQEAFVRAAERGEEERSEEGLVRWFYRVLRNAVIDHYRRRGASARRDEALERDLGSSANLPEAWNEEACRCVLALAEGLKPELARALRRIEVEGTSIRDLAEEEGISLTNAGVRVHRARQELKRRVTQSCRTCAEHGCFDCTCGGDGGPRK